MGRFSWIFYSYVLFVISLMLTNAWYSVEGKPVLALGYISSWWFMLIIFLITFLSEWGSIMMERRE